MKQKFLIALLLFTGYTAFSQVGINTKNPQGILNIDGGKDNATTGTPTSAQQANDVVITNSGSIGVGVTSPITRLDVRSATGANTDNSIGIGYTAQKASDAAAGAIRYTSYNAGRIQFSDGVRWAELQSFPTKVVVVYNYKANNFTDRYPINTEKVIFLNNKIIDNYNAYKFYTPSGFTDLAGNQKQNSGFTAPRTGIYLVSVTMNLVKVSQIENSHAQLNFVVIPANAPDTQTTGTTVQTCTKQITATAASKIDAQTPLQCVAGVSLNKGDVLQIRLIQTVYNGNISARSDNAVSSNDYGFSNLSIAEQ